MKSGTAVKPISSKMGYMQDTVKSRMAQEMVKSDREAKAKRAREKEASLHSHSNAHIRNDILAALMKASPSQNLKKFQDKAQRFSPSSPGGEDRRSPNHHPSTNDKLRKYMDAQDV